MFHLIFVAGSLQGHLEALLTGTSLYNLSSFLRMFSLLLKELILDFYFM